MGAIVIWTRYDEGTESAEVATSVRKFKFKISLNCTDGTTLPQYGIYEKQNTGTKPNKSISSAHSILPKNAFNSPNDTK
jgi:hypothetical protein